ncbi:hypothetical protein AJ80_00537 [Polytolypa hystricis UAMH7299]|uniref:Nephrocystin 3-like N-terminal domain-containing protein n=1 Tax=Polytolypa hystricis (strain UAMH7299) TaxID=1447883 RepID=A0A2B7Z3C9_POLH7|nr:hypothetical protein AJ80_00537 [Polytolypa hystricis UAMH7299]
MLSIFLTEQLAQNMDRNLLFYFCSHQDEKRKTALTILRGLVYRIVGRHPKSVKQILPYFESPGKVSATLSSPEALWIIFRSLVQDPDLENSPPKTFRMVIVSRDISGLHSCARVKLDPDNEEQVANDIGLFISLKVKELSRIEGFSEEFRTTVQKPFLERRSEGAFLSVGFVMNELSQKRACTEVLQALDDLPKGLPAIFQPNVAQEPDNDPRLAEFRIKLEDHLELAQTCSNCVAHSGLQNARLWFYNNRSWSRESPMLKYAVFHWPKHARHCSTLAEKSLSLSKSFFFQKNSGLRNNWWETYNEAKYRGYLSTLPLLHIACVLRIVPWVSAILKQGHWMRWFFVDVEETDEAGCTPLHIAAKKGDKETIQLLIDHGVDINTKDKYGQTALHIAAYNKHKEIVQLLIDPRVDVNIKEKYEKTALHIAALKGYKEIVQLLIDQGADVNIKDKDGQTAWHLAVEEEYEMICRGRAWKESTKEWRSCLNQLKVAGREVGHGGCLDRRTPAVPSEPTAKRCFDKC